MCTYLTIFLQGIAQEIFTKVHQGIFIDISFFETNNGEGKMEEKKTNFDLHHQDS
jgi:hypothetical protein